MPRIQGTHLAAWGALLALVIIAGATPVSNNDIWLHLTTGQLTLERGGIPRVDEYSYTHTGAPYIPHEWLAQVIFALVYRYAGVFGLVMLKPIAMGVTAVLVGSTCRRLRAGPLAAHVAAMVAVAAMTSHMYVRPHLFTFICLAGTARLLAGRKGRGGAGRLPLFALQALWVNLHGGFLLGIVMAATLAAFTTAAGMALVSLINPEGWHAFPFVLRFTDPVLRDLVQEWSGPFSPPFFGSVHFYVYTGILALAGAAAVHHARRGRPGQVVFLLSFLALSFVSKRHVSVLGVAAAPWIGVALTETFAARKATGRPDAFLRRRGQAIAGGLSLAAALWIALWGLPAEKGPARRPGLSVGENIPVAAMDYVDAAGLEGDALATYAFGAYVIHREYPATRVFIDSRSEVHPPSFLSRYVEAMRDPRAARRLLAQYPADYAVLSYRLEDVEGPVTLFESDPDWKLVYFDDLAMIYVRDRQRWSRLVAQDGYSLANPYLFLSGRHPPGEEPSSMLDETERALDRSPGSRITHLMHATAQQRAGRHEAAIATMESALDLLAADDTGRGLLWGMLGTSYLEVGRKEQAAAAFRRLLTLHPDSEYARRMLAEIEAGAPPGR